MQEMRTNQKELEEIVTLQHAQYRRKKTKVKKSESLWLLSFSDLSMILITLFILLLSISDTNRKKAEIVSEALRKRVNSEDAGVRPDSIIKISQRLNEAIKRLQLDQMASITYDTAGLSVEFKDALLFGLGSTEPNLQSQGVVKKIMDLIAETPESFTFRFEGHTDDIPLKGSKIPSNWELSSLRGIRMMREFEMRGISTKRMAVVAYADTRPKVPIEGLRGSALEHARTQNRRVVIRIE